MESEQILRFEEGELRRLHLFRFVHLDTIKGLLDACTIRTLTPGEILLAPGEGNRTLYGVLTGRLRVHLGSPENEPLAVLGPGETAGELSVIDHEPTAAFVVADEPCRLLVMEEDILWSLVHSSHAAACNLLFILARKLRHADAVIVDGAPLEHVYQHFGSVDALTGLHNRFWFDRILQRQVQRTHASGSPLSVIMIDIDHFKAFNERHGHPYGDRVLYSVAHSLSNYLRPSEIIARYGGDEFIILLPEVSLREAQSIAGRLLRAVMDAVPETPDGQSIPHPTISAGVVEMLPGQTPDMFVQAAEEALLRAKHTA